MCSPIDKAFMFAAQSPDCNVDVLKIMYKLSESDKKKLTEFIYVYKFVNDTRSVSSIKNLIEEKNFVKLMTIIESLTSDTTVDCTSFTIYALIKSDFNVKFSYTIPTRSCIEEIKDFVGENQILEVFSGLGLLAGCLRAIGLNVITTDSYTFAQDKETFTQVEKLDAVNAVAKYPTNYLLLSWIPKRDTIGFEILKIYKGNFIILFGESDCCAEDQFYNFLEKEWTLIKKPFIKSWNSIYDRCEIFERNKHPIDKSLEYGDLESIFGI
jgi:hypothetical protein